MTGTDIHEALHAVADTTPAPAPDRLAFQRLVRQERRRRVASRAGLAAGVAAAVAVVATTAAVPFLPTGGDEASAPPASAPPARVDLQGPAFLVRDQRLTAIDPQGEVHDLGVRVEEVIGSTSESVYAVDGESGLVRFDIANGDEGPGGPWSFERVDSGVGGPVQSAQLSADGRWLGWIDLEETLHVRDLKAGTTSQRRLPAGSYLVDLAQGTGAALVSENVDLVLYAGGGPVDVPTQEHDGVWGSTATRDRVAVVERQDSTRVFDVSSGAARSVAVVPGAGRLSPYGDLVASVSIDADDAGSTAWLTTPGEEPVRLAVEGRPEAVAWADDDTVLVTSNGPDGTAVYACEATDLSGACARLDLGTPTSISLSR